MLHVTAHAIQRYQERVRACSLEDARAALTSEIIKQAALFGAPIVRLATGQRIVIEGCTIITVLPAEQYRRQVRRHGVSRYHRR